MIMQNLDFDFDGDEDCPCTPLNQQPGMMYGFVPKIVRPKVCFRFDEARTGETLSGPHKAANESGSSLMSFNGDTLFFG